MFVKNMVQSNALNDIGAIRTFYTVVFIFLMFISEIIQCCC